MGTQGLARGIVLAGAGAAMVWVAHSAPVHTATGPRTETTTSPVDAAAFVCPGGTGGSGKAEIALTSSPASLTGFARGGGQVTERSGLAGTAPKPVNLRRGQTMSSSHTGGPVIIEATGGLAPGLAAAQFAQGDGSKALTARTCAGALNDAWIPAGQKDRARLVTLVLVNSGAHAATVDVDVTARDGDVPRASISDKAVPAHSRVEVNLPQEVSSHEGAVVHVRSEGAAVQSSVRDHAGSGDARGEELMAQYAAPGTTQVIPAAPVTSGRSTVRLAAPSNRGAVVRLQALSATGAASTDRVVTVPRGRTLDVTFDDLPGDVVSLRAVSETEIVAAAYAPVAQGKATDFAWAQAAPDLSGSAGTTIRGAGLAGQLLLAGSGSAVRARVVVTTKDGKQTTQQLDVPRDGARRVPVPQDASVWVSAPTQAGESNVHAAMMLRSGTKESDRVTTLTLTPSPWMRERTALVAR